MYLSVLIMVPYPDDVLSVCSGDTSPKKGGEGQRLLHGENWNQVLFMLMILEQCLANLQTHCCLYHRTMFCECKNSLENFVGLLDAC